MNHEFFTGQIGGMLELMTEQSIIPESEPTAQPAGFAMQTELSADSRMAHGQIKYNTIGANPGRRRTNSQRLVRYRHPQRCTAQRRQSRRALPKVVRFQGRTGGQVHALCASLRCVLRLKCRTRPGLAEMVELEKSRIGRLNSLFRNTPGKMSRSTGI